VSICLSSLIPASSSQVAGAAAHGQDWINPPLCPSWLHADPPPWPLILGSPPRGLECMPQWQWQSALEIHSAWWLQLCQDNDSNWSWCCCRLINKPWQCSAVAGGEQGAINSRKPSSAKKRALSSPRGGIGKSFQSILNSREHSGV
jgi:hypothetical protein